MVLRELKCCPRERSEISREAVKARWRKAGKTVLDIPEAIKEGELKFEGVSFHVRC